VTRRSGASARARRGWTVAALVLAATVPGCGGEPDPHDELADAVRATSDASVTFALGARVDGDALAGEGEGTREVARFLEDAALTGARDPDAALRVAVSIGAEAPLLEVVSDPSGGLSMRTGLGSLLGVDDRDPAAQLDPLLTDLGVDEAGRRALAVSFAGGWVAVSDVDDLGSLLARDAEAVARDATAPDAEVADAGEGPTLERLLEAVTVVGARDAGDVRRLDVRVDARALAQAVGPPADEAGEVSGPGADRPGTVVLRDGLLQEVRVALSGDDVPSTSGEDGGAGGIELVLTVTPVAEGRAVLVPDPDASLRAEELFDLVERLRSAPGVSP
jgi:hypothetical protein